jgi:hypothetical protein
MEYHRLRNRMIAATQKPVALESEEEEEEQEEDKSQLEHFQKIIQDTVVVKPPDNAGRDVVAPVQVG